MAALALFPLLLVGLSAAFELPALPHVDKCLASVDIGNTKEWCIPSERLSECPEYLWAELQYLNLGDHTRCGAVSGHVFSDVNSNGHRDAGDSGIPHTQVILHKLVNSEDIHAASTFTNDQGEYVFSHIPHGDGFRIKVVLPQPDIQTFSPMGDSNVAHDGWSQHFSLTGGHIKALHAGIHQGCRQFIGYASHSNSDHFGDDIRHLINVGDLTEVAAACTADPMCLSWNSNGWVKSKNDVNSQVAGACLYTKIGCREFHGYTAHSHADHFGDDIQRIELGDLSKVAATCSEDPTCLSWNSNGWVKTKNDINSRVAGSCLYTKTGIATVSLGRYPGYTGPLEPRGTLFITSNHNELHIKGLLWGLTPGAGKLHIHEGQTCAEAAAVGGHFHPGTTTDPWAAVEYDIGADGSAAVSIAYHPLTVSEAMGHALVVHTADGARVGCGVIHDVSGAGMVTLGAYPGYLGPLEPQGTLFVTSIGRELQIAGFLRGLNHRSGGGLHIHVGDTCAEAAAVGAHFHPGTNNDPWTATHYDTAEDGTAAISIAYHPMAVFEAMGRALVVHTADGARVGCGVIHSIAALTSSSSSSSSRREAHVDDRVASQDFSSAQPKLTGIAAAGFVAIGFIVGVAAIGVIVIAVAISKKRAAAESVMQVLPLEL